jgi:serine/threonine protein kinase
MATVNIFPEGFKLADRYEIVRVIGQGGMGIVYLARDTMLNDSLRAIKTIKPELLQDPKGAVRLKKEAQAAMGLSHPNIVKVYTYEEWQHMAFIVMEYVEGQTLGHLIAEKETLSVEEFMPLAEQICTGLAYSHEQNILHQDIKPANIFIDTEGTAKIADFGIARVLTDTSTRLSGQMTSGTLTYMSPEMIRGKKPSVSSDIYALGSYFLRNACWRSALHPW